MKQVISFNEEYMDLCVAMAIPENENPDMAFRKYVKDRAMALLGIPETEAESLLSREDPDALLYNPETGAAQITFSSDSEYLQLADVPENSCGAKKEEYVRRYREEVQIYCAAHTKEGRTAKYYYFRAMEEAMRFFLSMDDTEIRHAYEEARDSYKEEKR